MTPIRQQYLRIKRQYRSNRPLPPRGLYETFDEDAKIASRELEIVLTSARWQGYKIPLAGIPYHALDNYLAKLIIAATRWLSASRWRSQVKRRYAAARGHPAGHAGHRRRAGAAGQQEQQLPGGGGVGEGEAGLAFVDITTSELPRHSYRRKTVLRTGATQAREIIMAKGAEAENLAENVTRVDDYWVRGRVGASGFIRPLRRGDIRGFRLCEPAPGQSVRQERLSATLPTRRKRRWDSSCASPPTPRKPTWRSMPRPKKNLEIFQGARSGTAEGSLLSVIDATKTRWAVDCSSGGWSAPAGYE